MNNKLIFGLALAAVLISGPFIRAQADDIGPMCWAGFCPAQRSDMDHAKINMDKSKRDMDKPDATREGESRYDPNDPYIHGFIWGP